MRSIWKGTISFGLVSIPISLFSDSELIGIAKVVIKTRQQLAAIRPQQKGLMLDLMGFPAELLQASDLRESAAIACAG